MWSSERPTMSFNMPKNSTFTRTIVIVTDGPARFGFHWRCGWDVAGVRDWGLASRHARAYSGRRICCARRRIFVVFAKRSQYRADGRVEDIHFENDSRAEKCER